MSRISFTVFIPAAALSLLVLSSCGKSSGDAQGEGASPITVAVVKTAPKNLTLISDYPGRVSAFHVAEIRPQVSGIIQKRLFLQGSTVRAGQPLFQIDAAPFRATAMASAAALQRANATLAQAKANADRQTHLFDAKATSRQDYEDAITALAQAKASVAEARASLQKSQLDVRHTTVTSPIGGRIDETSVTEGALVTASQTDALAKVQQIDQVYVDVRAPASQLPALQALQAAGGKDTAGNVEVLDANGKAYGAKGQLLFSGISVDETTGEVIVRILVPNPRHALLPGMYVRARLPQTQLAQAITVPQQAVQHDSTGRASVLLVNKKGIVETRLIEIGTVVNGAYLVTSGLKPNENIIVEGMDRVQPEMPVIAKAWKP